MGSAFSLFESVVAVQNLFPSSLWESDVCAQSARLQQKYAVIASSAEILVVDTSIILSLRTFEVQQKRSSKKRVTKKRTAWVMRASAVSLRLASQLSRQIVRW